MESKNSNELRITALFANEADVDKVYQSLRDYGVDENHISVVMSDYSRKTDQFKPGKTEAADSAGRGALLGGAAGGVTAAIAAMTVGITLPALGLVFVGPLLAGLAGATGGAAAGGAIGALVGSGFSKEQAESYDTKVREGNFLISVVPNDLMQIERIERLFGQNQGYEVVVHWGKDSEQTS